MKKPKVESFDPEDICPEYCREIIMASWLYYHAKDEGLQSPLTDAEYDQRVQYVVANWSAVPIAFKARISRDELSATGVGLKATAFERHQARDWARSKK